MTCHSVAALLSHVVTFCYSKDVLFRRFIIPNRNPNPHPVPNPHLNPNPNLGFWNIKTYGICDPIQQKVHLVYF